MFAALLVLGCPQQNTPAPPDLPAVGGPVSLIRIPVGGGTVEAYDPDSLVESVWSSRVPFPPIREVLGVNLEAKLLVAVDTLKNLVAVDLESRGLRNQAAGVELATMVPDGSVYTVNLANRIVRAGAGTPVPYRTTLPMRPVFQVGTLGDRYVAIIGTKPPKMLVMNAERQLGSFEVSPGEAAATYWGDLVAVAADKQVAIYDTEEPFRVRTIATAAHARHVIFSPSGHRIYVGRDDPTIVVYDRYTLAKVSQIELPGIPVRLRTDLSGRWLLARPTAGDSSWIVDLATGNYVATVQSEWEEDLPTVAGGSTVVIRRDGDIIAQRMGPKQTELGRIIGGAKDRWVVTSWLPRDRQSRAVAAAESLLIAQDSLLTPGPSTGAIGERLYLQVSSSQNPEWSKDLAKQLTTGGYPARVLDPGTPDDGYRVVIGPYETRDAAEEAGRKLGRPYFILTNPTRN